MISTDKVEPVLNSNELNVVVSNKQKWNEQPHIGKYKLIKTIGKGNFAKVKLAQHVTTGKKVAVKVIDKTALNSSSLNKLFREVKIMKTLDHPNIVKLFEVIESERHVYLVMEYAPKGEVFDYLVQNGRMKEKEARQRFREIVSAIQYCHQKNIVHRDLKAENLLLGNDLQIKIADFGFANIFDGKRQLDTFCGSPPYAAPELFQGRKYDGPEVDVWSLGVILYTLVSGSLPFDGHNMRELRERVLRGKYRIPFYMSTDCELLLKKMLVVTPYKRYTLQEVMKDKWMNIGYEDCLLQPYKEPQRNYEDQVKLAVMKSLGFTKEEVLDSLFNAKFNNVTATYLLLDYDLNTTIEQTSKSDSVSSLKNVSSYQNAKDGNQKNLAVTNPANENSSSKNIARSGSAVESRVGNKPNGDSKENNKHMFENEHKSRSSGRNSSIKQSPSIGTNNTFSQEQEVSKISTNTGQSKPNAIRIPGAQPNVDNNLIGTNNATGEFSNGDNLLVPNNKVQTWVKRNNTFTYADKNTTSEIESRPVTRTKNMMNMLSQVTPATIPLPMDQGIPAGRKQQHSGYSSRNSKTKEHKGGSVTRSQSNTPETSVVAGDSACDELKETSAVPCQSRPAGTTTLSVTTASTTNEEKLPSATGDKIVAANTVSSTDSNVIMVSSEETEPIDIKDPSNPGETTNMDEPHSTPQSQTKQDRTNIYPSLNKPRHLYSNNLFRSFTSKIQSSKLIRRLTSQNPPSNRHKRHTDGCNDPQNQSSDPWTPMDSANDKRKISASSDFTGDRKTLNSDQQKSTAGYNPQMTSTLPAPVSSVGGPNQLKVPLSNKPRIMHLMFRKSLTTKIRPPELIISETMLCLRSLSVDRNDNVEPSTDVKIDAKTDDHKYDFIDWVRLEQISSFVIACQGRLPSDHPLTGSGTNQEVIQWEIEVFRVPKRHGHSTSYVLRIKKQQGSSTRFKAIHKILIAKLTPVLSNSVSPASTLANSNNTN